MQVWLTKIVNLVRVIITGATHHFSSVGVEDLDRRWLSCDGTGLPSCSADWSNSAPGEASLWEEGGFSWSSAGVPERERDSFSLRGDGDLDLGDLDLAFFSRDGDLDLEWE